MVTGPPVLTPPPPDGDGVWVGEGEDETPDAGVPVGIFVVTELELVWLAGCELPVGVWPGDGLVVFPTVVVEKDEEPVFADDVTDDDICVDVDVAAVVVVLAVVVVIVVVLS